MEIESSVQFWSEFSPRLEAMRAKLGALRLEEGVQQQTTSSSSGTPTRAAELWDLKQGHSSLQKFYTESTGVLPMYDIRRAQEELEAFSKEVKALEEVFVPRTKFRFSDKAWASVNSSGVREKKADFPVASSTGATQSSEEKKEVEKPKVPPGTVIISGRNKETISLYDADFSRSDFNGQLLVQNCTNCIINVFAVAGSIRLEDLVSCTVLLGPCRTSVYIDTCHECTFLVASHQLRIHKTYRSKLFVRTRTHPIIEDCSGLAFGPYILKHSSIDKHFETAGLSDAHCWDNVVDFRWHRMSQSPNWSVIPESERRIDSILLVTPNGCTDVQSLRWEHPTSNDPAAPLPDASMEIEGNNNDNSGVDSEDEI